MPRTKTVAKLPEPKPNLDKYHKIIDDVGPKLAKMRDMAKADGYMFEIVTEKGGTFLFSLTRITQRQV